MKRSILIPILGITLLLAGNTGMQGQIVGESEATSIRMKKPAGSRQASGEQSDMNVRDEAPPEIRIISPRVDTGFTARLSASGVFIAGRISDQSPVPSLRINDSVVRLDENGFFHFIPQCCRDNFRTPELCVYF